MNFVTNKEACRILGISRVTLLDLESEDKIQVIRTKGGHRRYNVDKYLNEVKTNNSKKLIKRENICYIRVSTFGQRDDLERQKKYMMSRYPKYTLIEDIGSGINFNRRGLRKIIHMAIEGRINKLVIAYKDRLTRFGYDLIEDLIKEYSNGEIIIENDKERVKEPNEELVEDVMQILNVYTAKMNGLRKYGKI